MGRAPFQVRGPLPIGRARPHQTRPEADQGPRARVSRKRRSLPARLGPTPPPPPKCLRLHQRRSGRREGPEAGLAPVPWPRGRGRPRRSPPPSRPPALPAHPDPAGAPGGSAPRSPPALGRCAGRMRAQPRGARPARLHAPKAQPSTEPRLVPHVPPAALQAAPRTPTTVARHPVPAFLDPHQPGREAPGRSRSRAQSGKWTHIIRRSPLWKCSLPPKSRAGGEGCARPAWDPTFRLLFCPLLWGRWEGASGARGGSPRPRPRPPPPPPLWVYCLLVRTSARRAGKVTMGRKQFGEVFTPHSSPGRAGASEGPQEKLGAERGLCARPLRTAPGGVRFPPQILAFARRPPPRPPRKASASGGAPHAEQPAPWKGGSAGRTGTRTRVNRPRRLRPARSRPESPTLLSPLHPGCGACA